MGIVVKAKVAILIFILSSLLFLRQSKRPNLYSFFSFSGIPITHPMLGGFYYAPYFYVVYHRICPQCYVGSSFPFFWVPQFHRRTWVNNSNETWRINLHFHQTSNPNVNATMQCHHFWPSYSGCGASSSPSSSTPTFLSFMQLQVCSFHFSFLGLSRHVYSTIFSKQEMQILIWLIISIINDIKFCIENLKYFSVSSIIFLQRS